MAAQVFTRERLNGYYGIGSFALANTLSSLPFIFAITVISTLCVYYLASLNDDSDRVIYFILDLFISLLVVRHTARLLSCSCFTLRHAHEPDSSIQLDAVAANIMCSCIPVYLSPS